ncbi:SufBD protein [Murimonas intestini]|nr:SufBD protein [Murimonas intestini]MCR1840852.1 SufBD protein [Murimonas intestini]MCR1866029.1 SufBD protein [Murimonas intestini]MCR1883449.1 SufBD protein [Murimonas intestini]
MKTLKVYQEIENLVLDLRQQDSRKAYESLKVLKQKSREDAFVYSFLDDFIQMMEDKNSYFRTRGLQLIAANARWDEDNKIDEVVDKYLKHIMDEKPITARQCIQALPEIAQYKEGLKADIVEALQHAKPECYRESMIPLVKKDIEEALQKIKCL